MEYYITVKDIGGREKAKEYFEKQVDIWFSVCLELFEDSFDILEEDFSFLLLEQEKFPEPFHTKYEQLSEGHEFDLELYFDNNLNDFVANIAKKKIDAYFIKNNVEEIKNKIEDILSNDLFDNDSNKLIKFIEKNW